MNAAATATSPLSSSAGPSLSELEDLLYDILATGADPGMPPGTLEAVQSFIHEHARSKKSHAEFVAFFQARALPMRPQGPALLALPPLEMRGRAAESPPLELLTSPREPQLTAAAAPSGKPSWALVTFVAVAVLAFGWAGFAWVQLRAELDHARVQSARNAAELTAVRQEAGELQRALQQNAQVMERVEHKSELLLQTVASPLDPNLR